MSEWTFAQTDPSEELAHLHHFSLKKHEADGDTEFLITVREYATKNEQGMRFFAVADKQTNQITAPYTPCGWGPTLLKALSECVKAIQLFPYQGPRPG